MTGVVTLVVALGVTVGVARAAEPTAPSPPGGDWGDDFEVGPAAPAAPEEPASRWSGVLTARSRVGFWLERLATTPLSTLRTSLDATLEYARGPLRVQLAGHAEVDPAYALQRAHYDAPTYDRYVALADVRKSHVAYRGEALELAFGYQIVPWGEAFMLGALDITNPRDLREPGLAELDELRLPVLSTRVGLARGGQRLELLWVHEARFDYRSPPLGPNSLFAALLPDDLEARLAGRDLVIVDAPARWGVGAQQLFVRWSYRGPGLDLAAHVASALDLRGVPGVLDPLAGGPAAERVALPLVHRRIMMTGLSAVVPFDPLLFKGELGVFFDRPLVRVASDGTHEERELALDVMASLVWDATPTTQLALEWQGLFVPDRPAGAEYLLHPDVPRWALRVAQRLWSDRLALELVALVDADRGGVLAAVVRAGAELEVAEGWRVGVTGVTYQPSHARSGPLSGFDRNDQFVFKVRWDVAVE